MPKFYVLSGHIREIMDAESVMDACVKSVQKHESNEGKMQYLHDFAVSERGLSHEDYDPEADYIVDLGDVLESAGWDME
tara:strand:- start:4530 stop:4766 length:237 start_codon:yes stop_codon:yes gene_type:complete